MKKETKEMLEELIQDYIGQLATENLSDEERDSISNTLTSLIKSLQESEKINIESEEFEKCEKNKILIESLKVGGLLTSGLISIIAYNYFQNKVIKFEETGRLTTFAAKELHLPKFFNK